MKRSEQQALPTATYPDAEHIVIWAPVGRTAGIVLNVLDEAGLVCRVCDHVDAFCEALGNGAGAALLLEEAFTQDDVVDRVVSVLEDQPSWSDIPVKVFVSDCARIPHCFERLQRLSSRRGVTILERPISPVTLVSIVEAALRNRRRQYRLRDSLEELREMNDTLEERVTERTEEVRELAASLAMAEQAERRRISRVLHDGLQQVLYAAKMQIGMAGRGPAAAGLLPQLNQTLEDAITITRSLTVQFSPPGLHREGLAASLRWLAGQMREQHGLRVDVRVHDPCEPASDDLRELLYQSTRELLFNIVKHADVSEARVELHGSNGRCIVRVADEGDGFDPEVLAGMPEGTGGFGLISMANRVRIVGGEVDVQAAPGAGARISLSLPAAAR